MADKINPVFTEEQWTDLIAQDPTFAQFKSASSWQGSFDTAKVYLADSPLSEIIGFTAKDGKGTTPNWRMLQKKCWELYRSFGPISAAVNSKADYASGHGFSAFSTDLQIRTFLKDLFYSYRNKLYAGLNGWVVRMLAEGELFVLLAFDDNGKATVRVLEPDRIGKGTANAGILTNPEDVTQTLFYEHFYERGVSELIPDINIAFNPDLMAVARNLPLYSEEKTVRSKATGGKFREVGGFRRFVLHWKNLTGIHEYKRDLSVITTVIEAIHLYWNAIKWQLDHKKAQCAYTNVVSFSDTPQGRISYSLWEGLTAEEQANTGLTGTLTPGSTVFLLPGMTFEVKAPQLTKLEGENQDLMNVAGAGMKSPQDMFQGQSAGATHASLRASRSPLEVEIKNTQYKLKNFMTYEFLRACFFVESKVGGFPGTFKKDDIESFREGEAKFTTVDVEPIELVDLTFPDISFEEQMMGRASAYLGSKHSGLRALGLSDATIAQKMGVSDLSRQRMERALEEKIYGIKDAVLNEKSPGAPAAGSAVQPADSTNPDNAPQKK